MIEENPLPRQSGDGDETRVSPGLADAAGNRVSIDDLKDLMEIPPGNTIAQLSRISLIGVGGIGAVYSAHEPVLNREIAIKILRPAYQDRLHFVSDFIREARITAQIDHPNVIPVHRLGVFDDAGVYFTMKRVVGTTLAKILKELREGNAELARRYSRSRLLEIFISVCHGVAFAHSKGILHRDLKPGNIMVGEYGEVFIADWGLALYRAEHDHSQRARRIELGQLPDDEPQLDEKGHPRAQVSGTPAYMAPEQLTGQDNAIDEQTEVYALGAILYSILTWEPSPFPAGLDADEIMKLVAAHKFQRPRRRAPRRKIPYELEAICLKAMAGEKKERYASVRELLADVRNHLDQYPVSAYSPQIWYRFYKLVRRRPLVPLTLLAALLTLGIWNGTQVWQNYLEAASLMGVIKNTISEAEMAHNHALSARQQLNRYYTREGSTDIYGKAAELRSRFNRTRDEYEIAGTNAWELLNQVARLHGNWHVAGPIMAKLLGNQLDFAIATGNTLQQHRIAERLHRLPPEARRQLYAAAPTLGEKMAVIERNCGELELRTNLPGCRAAAARLNDPEQKTAQTESSGASGAAETAGPADPSAAETTTVLPEAPEKALLPAGPYRITLTMPEDADTPARTLNFPVTVRCGITETVQLQLPRKWPKGTIYIPGGSFIFGNRTFDNQAARTTLAGYFIAQKEVTFGEYLKFWKSLPPEQRERFRACAIGIHSENGFDLHMLWDDEGNLAPDVRPDCPVVGISGQAAEAFCDYMSRRTGMRYRLPTTLEWEKAARGVDGREYIWGDTYRPGRANIADQDLQNKKRRRPEPGGAFPADVTIYGVQDMAGNVREIVRNPSGTPPYQIKGASFRTPGNFARIPDSDHFHPGQPDVGFRYVVEVPQERPRTRP